jgi:hypothetical protein
VTRLVQVGAVPPAARKMQQARGDRRDERMDRAAIAALERRNEAGEFAADPAAFCRARRLLTAPANFVDPSLAARAQCVPV